MNKDKIIIFSDGASKGNPGPGGWGAVIIKLKVSKVESKEGEVWELGGGEAHTTNNRMELSGALYALKEIHKSDEEILFYTDSKYVINGMTAWIYGWQKNGWKTKENKDVLNKDLWEKLVEYSQGRKINWHYVGGHVGVAGNERCDEIADAMALGEKVHLYKGLLSGYGIDIKNLGHDEAKKEAKSNKGAKAYSYLSLVDGKLFKDKAWAECEKRVKGKKGVKFQKAVSEYHEAEIIRKMGVK